VHILALESNHDLRMLENGPYPGYLKRRILSEQGHLSNPDACDAMEQLAGPRLQRVVALHRSNTNNSASIVRRELTARAAAIGLTVPIEVAPQNDVLDSAPPQGSLFDDATGATL
jgi:phosphoribosyl 1,2-cyclic phosphodiesterase